MDVSSETHCFFCRKRIRKDGGLHTCYDIVEVLENKISRLEANLKSYKFRNELLRGTNEFYRQKVGRKL